MDSLSDFTIERISCEDVSEMGRTYPDPSGRTTGRIGRILVTAQTPTPSGTAPTDVTAPATDPATEGDDDANETLYPSSIKVDESQLNGLSHIERAAALQRMATTTPAEAEAAALVANAGATAKAVELDDEDGNLVYTVELDNGTDVKVDAGNGTILYTEPTDAETDDDGQEVDDHEDGETDDDGQEVDDHADGETNDDGVQPEAAPAPVAPQ